MIRFDTIHQRALTRKGGESGLQDHLLKPVTSDTLKAYSDDRWLSEMTHCIFQAGFVWRVVDQKWPDFESVFMGFDPLKMTLLAPEQWESIGKDERIIRNMQKINSVAKNAQFILDIQKEHGQFSHFIADWPSHDLMGLLEMMKKRGDRLGGATGQRVLRNMGKDTFVLSNDVLLCLKDAGLDIKSGSSKREMKLIQEAFNQWHDETGIAYCNLSRICACSIGENMLPH